MPVRKLLLADDSVTIQRVIELTFAGEDVHVVAVSDGEQAIARIPAERPDIVLADIGMPKRSGYDVAAFVKGHPDLKRIPVLLLAGAFEPVDEAKAQQVGSDGVLVKPFEPQHVIALVREFLDGRGAAPAVPAPARAAEPEPARPVAPPSDPGPRIPDAAPAEPALDAYFDRLDAALASKAEPPRRASEPVGDVDLQVPTLDDVLSRPAPAPVPLLPAAAAPPPPAPMPEPRTRIPDPGSRIPDPAPMSDLPERNVIADVFERILAAERGEPGASPLRIGSAPAEPVVTDALVDEVAVRVIQKLGPATAREIVVQVVSEIAERLVREEIARIRGK